MDIKCLGNAILGTICIGPLFFEGNLNGGIYLEFLDVELPQLLEDVPLNVRQNQWFQHNGAPAHSTDPVTYWLNENYPDRWIGRRGRFPWPARSRQISPHSIISCGDLSKIKCMSHHLRQETI